MNSIHCLFTSHNTEMASQRRRHHYHHHNNNLFRLLLPVISAIFVLLFVLFLLLSILAPSPTDSDQLRHSTSHSTLIDDSNGVTVFRVPKDGGSLDRDIWSSRNAQYYHGCSDSSKKFAKAEDITCPNRYLAIAASGGLNQQRTGIVDAVVAARILNATLVIPKLDQKSFWKDASNFSEIFDVDWFISFLSKDVKIIKQLPKKGGKTLTTYNMRVPRKCNERCYQKRVLPVLLKRHVVQLSKFDYRLSNRLDTDLQKLRCRVNYHALSFTDPIHEMGEKLVQRMRLRSKHFIALHLRFEPDMLAFSGCYYGGGDKERKELGAIRKRWKTLHISNPDKERRHGKCPLTPLEVGLMLRALGYGSDVHIYVASGEVYGGEETLAPLKALFPHFHSKETIATKDELEPFSRFSSRMAALDFIVCDESDVFVTNNNGNMARILAGRRKYFGHKPTIRPNAKKLYRLFLNQTNTTWEVFASKVRSYQRGFMGEPNEVRPGRGEFHENPACCICEDTVLKAKNDSLPRKVGKGMEHTESKKDDIISDDQNDDDDELGFSDMDDDEDERGIPEKGLYDGTALDYDAVTTSEEPELEEMLSD
ncbi:O-fucosyltransferase 16-like isoform X2 [Mangifera indica]|uniref:O-fucosyltransferase 16-like isoform X2 n=1 Tax=Mangifera indica TaxID=29780 RepID=UPI001CFA6684|nr:O-fucosyltransferase 16-like isoform X2 [Mangifera indica]